MRVRFFTQPEGEKYAGSLMVEKTIEDHTSAGVKPTVFVGKATEADKTAHQAEYLAFAKPAPAEARGEEGAPAASEPAAEPKAVKKPAAKKARK